MIFIFTKYGRLGASSRVRTLQYFDKSNILHPQKVIFNELITNKQLEYKIKKNHFEIFSLIFSFLKRLKKLIKLNKNDLIYIEKELYPFFPFFIESIFLFNKKYILNYDDAVFDIYESNNNSFIRFFLKNKHKHLIKNSYLTICGNNFLANYAKKAGCKNIKILPSVINYSRYKKIKIYSSNDVPTITWIGQKSTTKNLYILKTVFQKLALEKKFILKIIGSGDFSIKGVEIIKKEWSEDNEIMELLNSDIGIMPLIRNRFAYGKCGYKLVQYMGAGIPVVASNFGANKKIVIHGENGFLANTKSEWFYYLKTLIEDNELRKKLGELGKRIVKEKFSVESSEKTFISFFQINNSRK